MNPSNISLVTLRKRLEALPDLKKASSQGDLYGRFQKQANIARLTASQANTALIIAMPIFDGAISKDIHSRLRGIEKTATKVRSELLADAANVTSDRTSNAFAGITESANSALELCKKAWKRGIDIKVGGRSELVSHLPQLLPGVGGTLRESVTQLITASSNLPSTREEVERVENLLKQFDELIGKLQLEGPVGRFLQALATLNGASLELVRDKEVQEFLTTHKLWSSFRVRLP